MISREMWSQLALWQPSKKRIPDHTNLSKRDMELENRWNKKRISRGEKCKIKSSRSRDWSKMNSKFSGSWPSTYRPGSTECFGEYNVCATRQSTVLRGWTSTVTAPALQSLRNVKPASLEGNTYKWGKASLLKGSFSVQRRSKENILLILGIVTLPTSSDGTNNACNSYWFDAHVKTRLQHRTLWTQTNCQWMM